MFNFIKNKLTKIYNSFTTKLASLFQTNTVDEETLKELELILLQADAGVPTTQKIIKKVRSSLEHKSKLSGQELKQLLEDELIAILNSCKKNSCAKSNVILLVGINGSGKTTFASKLAYRAQQQGKTSLFVAADTFRAAAPEQLATWAKRTNTEIVQGATGQDPASVIFSGCQKFKEGNFDQLIIDTAGRLQTKVNLMKELEKIKRVISKQLPNNTICTLLTIDSMLGQNSFDQAELFDRSTDVSGVVLTKMDGTGKGGIVFAIADQLQIPIAYISFGEQMQDCKEFDAQAYVHELLS